MNEANFPTKMILIIKKLILCQICPKIILGSYKRYSGEMGSSLDLFTLCQFSTASRESLIVGLFISGIINYEAVNQMCPLLLMITIDSYPIESFWPVDSSFMPPVLEFFPKWTCVLMF